MNPDFDHEEAIEKLVGSGTIYLMPEGDASLVRMAVDCNDIFAWACCDSEAITWLEIESLHEEVAKHPIWGAAIWCARKRGEKPQGPCIKLIKEAGEWTDDLESLADNQYDAAWQKLLAHDN